MTSGHGGEDPQEGRQAPSPGQGWQSPPQQGWQSPPQQGWQAPSPGQGWQSPPQQGWQAPPPYPGYAPAPAAPGYQPGPAPQRPDTVRFGIGAFVAEFILGVIGSVVTFASLDSLVDAELARAGVDLTADDLRGVLVTSAVIAVLFLLLQALFIWFAWQGRNWARIVLFVLGGLAILGGLASLAQPTTGFLSALSVCQMLLAVAGVVLLARRPSSDWYRTMSWRRAAGHR